MMRALFSNRPAHEEAKLGICSRVRLDAPPERAVRQDAPYTYYNSLLVIVRCLAVAALVVVTTGSSAGAQDFEAFGPPRLLPPAGAMRALAQTGQPDWQFGYQLFHLLLEQKGMYSVSDFREPMDRRPRQSAIVLFGDLNRIPTDLRSRLEKFIASGGIVLVASDEDSFFKSLFQISDGPFEVENEESAYQGFRDCPVVKAFQPDTPILDGVNSLVANRSGAISRLDDRLGSWSILARLPNSVDQRMRRRSQIPLIAELKSRSRGGGRLLLIADHSILINGMLWHGDNAKLAVNLADWLSTGGRQEVVFIVDGEPVKAMLTLPPEVSDDLPPLEDLPTPTWNDLWNLLKNDPWTFLKFLNRFSAAMEDANVMNELLANQPVDLPTPRYRQALYIAAGILAAIYILRLMGKIGARPTTRPPRSVEQSAVVSQLRTLSSGELHSAGRELAQSALRQLTGSSDPQDWSIPVHDVEIEASFIHRKFVRENLKQLKKLATNSKRAETSPKDLKRLAKLISNVLGLQKEGRLRHASIQTHPRFLLSLQPFPQS
jgi:hypothetical protein